MFKKISIAVFISLVFGSASAQFKLLGDSTKEDGVNEKYCTKTSDITQDAADDLAESWGVSSNSIKLRKAFLVGGKVCCLILDTPKGPFYNGAYKFFSDGKTIIAGMNNVGYKPGQSRGYCKDNSR